MKDYKKILFIVLTVVGPISVYQVLFSAWMCGFQTEPSLLTEWQHRFYLRLVTVIVVGVAWGIVGVKLLKQRVKRPPCNWP